MSAGGELSSVPNPIPVQSFCSFRFVQFEIRTKRAGWSVPSFELSSCLLVVLGVARRCTLQLISIPLICRLIKILIASMDFGDEEVGDGSCRCPRTGTPCIKGLTLPSRSRRTKGMIVLVSFLTFCVQIHGGRASSGGSGEDIGSKTRVESKNLANESLSIRGKAEEDPLAFDDRGMEYIYAVTKDFLALMIKEDSMIPEAVGMYAVSLMSF